MIQRSWVWTLVRSNSGSIVHLSKSELNGKCFFNETNKQTNKNTEDYWISPQMHLHFTAINCVDVVVTERKKMSCLASTDSTKSRISSPSVPLRTSNSKSTRTHRKCIWIWNNRYRMMHSLQNLHVTHVVFLSCCPNCPSCLAHLNSIGWITWAIWAAIKKYTSNLMNHIQRIALVEFLSNFDLMNGKCVCSPIQTHRNPGGRFNWPCAVTRLTLHST